MLLTSVRCRCKDPVLKLALLQRAVWGYVDLVSSSLRYRNLVRLHQRSDATWGGPETRIPSPCTQYPDVITL